ncbi:YitT family protein [Sporomusa sp.]|uniref:YitT family protein n=1 Tax=Sporomusa sp. TaxID=2078658 RepID=UPI002BA5BFC1|nr:YitT family protein [Sporomusa sp.]HWR43404.1 YitT family protein [Sporomusa sp.]
MPQTRNVAVFHIKKYLTLFIGSILAAIGLEIFLVPNQIIDGGIVGIAIMSSHITGINLSVLVLLLNLPFLYVGYKQIGKSFALSTLFSIISLAGWVYLLHPVSELTNDLFLAAVFGGIILGIGVGLIIRNGGSLDGTEIMAILFDKQSGFSVGEIIMFFNLFILSSAGLVFSWEKAMYSLVAYFIAFKVIDITIEGLDESKGVMIVSDNPEEIAEALMARLGRGVTVLHGAGGFTGEPKKVLYSVITRLEIAKLKSIIYEKDEGAFVTIHEVHDVLGGRVKKRAIH